MLRLDRPLGVALKRLLDVMGSVVGLLLLWPLLCVLALLIKADSCGPVFFRQLRVGRNGREFRMWKLRTMVHDAELRGPGITSAGDPRITRVGTFLRRAKLDELPQLMNVLAGQMSLVGPRPEIAAYVSLYNDAERAVLRLKPGMTDPASLEFRHEEALLASAKDPLQYYRDVVMRQKLAINLEYARTAGVLSDIHVILRTLATVPRLIRHAPTGATSNTRDAASTVGTS